MRQVWAARWPGVWTWVREGLGNVPQLVRDLAAVGWCQLRRQHFIEPDECGGPDQHDWCERCGWCPRCQRRRVDLVGKPCGSPERDGGLQLP